MSSATAQSAIRALAGICSVPPAYSALDRHASQGAFSTRFPRSRTEISAATDFSHESFPHRNPLKGGRRAASGGGCSILIKRSARVHSTALVRESTATAGATIFLAHL